MSYKNRNKKGSRRKHAAYEKNRKPAKTGLTVSGVMQKHKRGFGFVITESDGDDDIFISQKSMNGAMDGDTVEVAFLPGHMRGSNREGEVKNITARACREVVGTFQKSKRFGFVVPDNKKMNEDVFIEKRNFGKAQKGDKVVAEIIKYPDSSNSAEGRITQVISRYGQPGGDIKALVRAFGLIPEFPVRAGEEAESVFAAGISADDIRGRRDLRGKSIMTVDGADSKDFDDAVSVEKMENGNWLLGVHIADVSHYVIEDSRLDREALKRGNSVYLLDQVIPMLPVELSNGICSLNPDEDRLTLSCDMEIDSLGQVVDHEIYESVIRSGHRMVYTDVSDIIENDDRELKNRYSDILDELYLMNDLAKLLASRRRSRGSLDFDLDESLITLDKMGVPTDIRAAERRTANGMIEEFMLLANETVAEHFFWKEAPFVYRVHEKPDKDKMKEFLTFLRGIGIAVNSDASGINPKTLCGILEKVKGKTYEDAVNTVMLRSMQKAVYDTECRGHFGLALKYYCHFTSPIRRYSDLIVHRIIKTYLHDGADAKTVKNFRKKTKEAAQTASATERNALELEREVEKMKKAEYMTYHVGEQYEGIVSGVTSFGIYAALENTVEGMIRLDELEDDYYDFEPLKYRVIGRRTHKTYSLGDKVNIRVKSVSVEDREIDFILS